MSSISSPDNSTTDGNDNAPARTMLIQINETAMAEQGITETTLLKVKQARSNKEMDMAVPHVAIGTLAELAARTEGNPFYNIKHLIITHSRRDNGYLVNHPRAMLDGFHSLQSGFEVTLEDGTVIFLT